MCLSVWRCWVFCTIGRTKEHSIGIIKKVESESWRESICSNVFFIVYCIPGALYHVGEAATLFWVFFFFAPSGVSAAASWPGPSSPITIHFMLLSSVFPSLCDNTLFTPPFIKLFLPLSHLTYPRPCCYFQGKTVLYAELKHLREIQTTGEHILYAIAKGSLNGKLMGGKRVQSKSLASHNRSSWIWEGISSHLQKYWIKANRRLFLRNHVSKGEIWTYIHSAIINCL